MEDAEEYGLDPEEDLDLPPFGDDDDEDDFEFEDDDDSNDDD